MTNPVPDAKYTLRLAEAEVTALRRDLAAAERAVADAKDGLAIAEAYWARVGGGAPAEPRPRAKVIVDSRKVGQRHTRFCNLPRAHAGHCLARTEA